jgi:hypothetical protein
MTHDDLALMSAVLAAAFGLAALFGWRGGNARADVALLGGSGAAFGGVAALLLA